MCLLSDAGYDEHYLFHSPNMPLEYTGTREERRQQCKSTHVKGIGEIQEPSRSHIMTANSTPESPCTRNKILVSTYWSCVEKDDLDRKHWGSYRHLAPFQLGFTVLIACTLSQHAYTRRLDLKLSIVDEVSLMTSRTRPVPHSRADASYKSSSAILLTST